jgi:hypothetical protein
MFDSAGSFDVMVRFQRADSDEQQRASSGREGMKEGDQLIKRSLPAVSSRLPTR